jgi:ribosomal protein S18 acetylase RimI-like enzyme
MSAKPAHRPAPPVRLRIAAADDIDALVELEERVFATDRLSRRSLRNLLKSPSAVVVVAAGEDGRLAGTAIILLRPRSLIARLYSIAVAPHMGGRGVASILLKRVEDTAHKRGCASIRLEVHETNHAAISRYKKCGYRQFGRRAKYYGDGGDALRFEKPLSPERAGPA